VPTQQRRRTHDAEVPERSWKVTCERGHNQPVRRLQSGSWELTTQHRYLVVQQHQLDVLGCHTTTTNHNQRQQPADNRIDQREQHEIILADPASATAIGVFERHTQPLDSTRRQ
jgi:hypothetical protein